MLALHDIHYLQVRENVGYKNAGHNIFLEDGIETYNIIERNCVISAISSFNML